MLFKIRNCDLAKLNSMTKYPSIPTYHAMGEKGVLRGAEWVRFDLAGGPVFGTEKIDGTNARLICCPDGAVVVGSREDLLWEKDDLIGNPAMGIVDAVRGLVRQVFPVAGLAAVTVFYGEVYGRGVGAGGKNYTGEGRVGFRLFDVVSVENWEEILSWPVEKIARWRDGGGQRYHGVHELKDLARGLGLEPVPPLFTRDAETMPTTIRSAHDFLLGFGASQCRLDGGGLGVPEGVVVRSADRRLIAKLRREDYVRAMRMGE